MASLRVPWWQEDTTQEVLLEQNFGARNTHINNIPMRQAFKAIF